ncbi:MAG: WbqC family protein [Elusimicrobiota bacterium]
MMIAIHQPQYLPYLGYFDKLVKADIFVLLDDVQFKKNEWQNRNRIKTVEGWQYLTVPVCYRYPEKIREVKISYQENWMKKHCQALKTNYHRAAYFEEYYPALEEKLQKKYASLADLNIALVRFFSEKMNIPTPLLLSSELKVSGESTERLVNICLQLGADTYLSGSGGKDYLDEDCFKKAKLKLVFQEYQHPRYAQLYGDFIPNLSVVDLFFNCGEKSLEVLCR